jgi:RNA polymerase sigma-70 factor (ECF subfamily)
MNRPALPAWFEGGFASEPGGAACDNFQRIFPAAASYGLKDECCMRDPDEALVLQSQRGDASAFAELIRRHQRMIHSLTFRMTGSETDADDLAQEAFINAYRQIESYHGASKFSTWLYRIAINACLSWRRRECRRAEVMTNFAESNEQLNGSETGGSTRDLNGAVHEALLKLPAKQRAAVMLTLYDGMNHAEAAEVLNCSEATVSWRVFAARRKLKKWLTAKEAAA